MDLLPHQLRAIGLMACAENIDDLIAKATKNRTGPRQLLEQIAAMESNVRSQKSLERRLAYSRIGRFKPIADYDWDWPKKIDRELISSALNLNFLEGAKNIVLVAPQGLGKTMIAKNICHAAILKGHSALFVSASQLTLDLAGQETPKALERRFKLYCKPSILCIDEIGYLSYDNQNADLLFQIICRRYESKSVILTTNLAFKDWHTIFPSATCATALIDRVVHHAEIISIEGNSFRLREAELSKKARNTKSKDALRQVGPNLRASM